MKIVLLVIGLCIVFVSILGYFDSPSMISNMIHSIMKTDTGTASQTTSSMLRSMGYPSRSAIVPIIQDSFLGLAIVGIGMAGFGTIAKNASRRTRKQVPEDALTESPNTDIVGNEKEKTSGLGILQERLARGEITSSEFQRLKELLKPDSDT